MYVFHCQADQLNDEFKSFKTINDIYDNITNVLNSEHTYASQLFNLSVQMVNDDPEKRPTIDEILSTLESFARLRA